MRLGFVCGTLAECCLCKARFPMKTEEAARIRMVSHLQTSHARQMLDRRDRKLLTDGRQFAEYHGPKWKNDFAG